jgi:hypothetical protein
VTPLGDDLTQRLLVQLDRTEATDTLYRYCSTIDRRDMVGLRATLADDIRARYGNADWIEGADDLVKWIDSASGDTLWQHHLISVYHVDINRDRAAALSYHTSHQMFGSDPETAQVIIARYHDQLARTPSGWKISEKVMEVLWAGERRDPLGRLEAIGGRGPSLKPFPGSG